MGLEAPAGVVGHHVVDPAGNPRVVRVQGGDETHIGTKETVEQQVALQGLLPGPPQQQPDPDAEAGACGRSGTAEIALCGGRRDDRLCAFGHGGGHQEFELARLVATQRQTAEVFPLDPDRRKARLGRQAGRDLEGRGELAQRHPRQPGGELVVPRHGNSGLTRRATSSMAMATPLRPSTAACSSSTNTSPARAALSKAGIGTRATLSVAASAAA